MPEAFKKYVLMHKEVAVAGVELDEATGLITAVYDVSNAQHLPLGVSVRKGIATAPPSTSGGWGAPYRPAVQGFAMCWKN